MWFLTALVCAAWIKAEGLALIDARWPALGDRITQSAAFAHAERALTWLKTFA